MTAPEFWVANRRGVPAFGIGEDRPPLSWLLSVDDEPVALTARTAAGETIRLDVPGRAHLVPWPLSPLRSRERVGLRFTASGRPRPLLTTTVEAGLLEPGDWTVDFVSPSPRAGTDRPRPAYLMRCAWSLADLGLTAADVARARLYASAHGAYELECNGERIGHDVLAPGWSSYHHRLRYQTHDLTPVVRDGVNVLGAWLADGWYRGRIGFDGGRWDWYGQDVALLAQLEIVDRAGRRYAVPLDTWRTAPAPITSVGLYEGERYDARLEQPGFSRPGFDDRDWTEAVVLPRSSFSGRIEAPTAAAVAVTETLAPVSVTAVDGRLRLDFGQNISGKLRIRTDGPAGTAIRLHHAEVLEDGRLGVRPLRSATSVDEYVCSDRGGQEWMPRFTLHGFRYAELEGWPGGPETVDIEALVVHTPMPRTGWFDCSDERLNRLHANVVWSMRDNFVDLPTDCPQRDERLGWTGDIQIFAPTALFLYACHGVLAGWLRDVAAEQAVKGHVPNFVPWIDCGFPDFPTAAWGDAAVIVPWEMFKHDTDRAVLADQYASMCRWVDLVDGLTGGTGLWNEGFQLGDWLDPAAPPEDPGRSHTDRHLVATAYHVRTSRIVAATARILGRPEDARRYQVVADRSAAAFRAEYVTPSGRVVSDTATALALAIGFDLLPAPEARRAAGRRLAALVAAGGYRIPTGFVGTPIICEALALTGHAEAAYRLLTQRECPSWLYPVSMGATTVWERWDSMLPDGSINPGDMTSFNHYALGSVAAFLHSTVAGLRRPASGRPEVLFAPLPGGTLSHARARHESPWGAVECGWRRDGEELMVTVELPSAMTGHLLLPGDPRPRPVSPGRHELRCGVDERVLARHGLVIDGLRAADPLPA